MLAIASKSEVQNNMSTDSPLVSRLATLLDQYLDCLLSADNSFSFHIIPLSDIEPEGLPTGFSLALSAWMNDGKPQTPDRSRDILHLRRHFDLLPRYIPPKGARKSKEYGIFRHDTEFVDRFHLPLMIDGKKCDFGVVLWTYSLATHAISDLDEHGVPFQVGSEGGVLTDAEQNYRRFMSTVGNIFRIYDHKAGSDADSAWVSFLVEYIWTHERPKVTSGFATVNEIVLVTARAIEHLMENRDVPQDAGGTVQEARHSPDFASVYWYGTSFEFTTNQAACIQVLWEAELNKTPALSGAEILDRANISQERLDKVFRTKANGKSPPHPAWNTMIVSPLKGRYKLAKGVQQNAPQVGG